MLTIFRTESAPIADTGKEPLLITSSNFCLAFRNYNSMLGSSILGAVAIGHEVEHSILPVSNLFEPINITELYIYIAELLELTMMGGCLKSRPARKVFNMHPQQVGERGSLPEAAQKC